VWVTVVALQILSMEVIQTLRRVVSRLH